MKGLILLVLFSINIVGLSFGIMWGDKSCYINSVQEIYEIEVDNTFQLIVLKPLVLTMYPGIYLGHMLVKPRSCE